MFIQLAIVDLVAETDDIGYVEATDQLRKNLTREKSSYALFWYKPR